MTKGERRIIVEAVKSQPMKSYGVIAEELGISKSTLLRAVAGAVRRPRGRRLKLTKKQKK